MSVFSKLSGSKKQAQKLQEEKKQKAKADNEPKAKYMHTPKHAYTDALNCVAGPTPGNTRESIREAAERRKTRISQNSSRTTLNGLYSVPSSSSGFNTMGSWEARRAMMQRDQVQICGAPIGVGPGRRSYQSSPLASVEPSTAGPSTVSSYEKLEMASLSPAPLRPSVVRRPSSLKKSVTIQIPADEPSPRSSTSQPSLTSDKESGAPLVGVVESAKKPLEKITVQSTEVPAELSSEEEKDKMVKTSKKRLSFWKKRNNQVAITAA